MFYWFRNIFPQRWNIEPKYMGMKSLAPRHILGRLQTKNFQCVHSKNVIQNIFVRDLNILILLSVPVVENLTEFERDRERDNQNTLIFPHIRQAAIVVIRKENADVNIYFADQPVLGCDFFIKSNQAMMNLQRFFLLVLKSKDNSLKKGRRVCKGGKEETRELQFGGKNRNHKGALNRQPRMGLFCIYN